MTKSNVLLALGTRNWGLPSSTDATRNWTLGEWERSKARFAYEIGGRPKNGWPSEPTRPAFPEGTPVAAVVRAVADYLEAVGARDSSVPSSQP